MSSLCRDLVFLILQFLDEEKYKETFHSLERESGYFFNMDHFGQLVLAGEWDAVEKYLAKFSKLEDNEYSIKFFFELRKQKYLEALDKGDLGKAAEILVKDLKIFAKFNVELFKDITQLITLDNFRQYKQLSTYVDAKTARSNLLADLKKFIVANPSFRDKLEFPALNVSRLKRLVNQSLNWQHQQCKKPLPNPEITTLLADHICAPSSGAQGPILVNTPLPGPLSKVGVFPTASSHGQLVTQSPALAGWMTSTNASLQQGAVVPSPLTLVLPTNAVPFSIHSRAETVHPAVEHQPIARHMTKRMRPSRPDEASLSGHGRHPSVYSPEYLPRAVARELHLGSCVTSLEFHPRQQTVLLVGTGAGDISIWEAGSRERLVHKGFTDWNTPDSASCYQMSFMGDGSVSVNRCLWSRDGSTVAVAFSKDLIQVYSYSRKGLSPQLQIDAHNGSVNDLAFAYHNKALCIISCGDDKKVKVWNAATGYMEYTFEGHEAPVFSLCPQSRGVFQYIISTAFDGQIKAWMYDSPTSRFNFVSPGQSCTAMAYSANGTRLFSCGRDKEGNSHLVEWNETEGSIKRSYSGLGKPSASIVQFDTARNHFLAAGDDSIIKFWDMDHTDILTTADAEGGLPASPRLRFNKEGSLLAVSTSDNGVKILANSAGLRLLCITGSRAPEISGVAIVSVPMTAGDKSRETDVRPRASSRDPEKVNGWKLADVVDPKQLKAITLPDPATSGKVLRLMFTDAGSALLALTSRAVHKVWKWPRGEGSSSGKSTPSVSPQPWRPENEVGMWNDTGGVNLYADDRISCMALSKNESYVLSASGGRVSLFNILSFKVMKTFAPPPPAATFLAFHPLDNNLVAIGMDDGAVQIFSVRLDKIEKTMKAHQRRVTGLAFSRSMNAMVSSGADAQVCAWSIDGWEKKKAICIQPAAGGTADLSGETRVQFNCDETRLLVSDASQIAVLDSNLDRLHSWTPRGSLQARIISAAYSCDGALVYVGFADAAIGVFSSEGLRLYCRVAPSSYASGSAYPSVIAAHPSEPGQIALGMSDGAVHLVEPAETEPETETRQGSGTPPENDDSGGPAVETCESIGEP